MKQPYPIEVVPGSAKQFIRIDFVSAAPAAPLAIVPSAPQLPRMTATEFDALHPNLRMFIEQETDEPGISIQVPAVWEESGNEWVPVELVCDASCFERSPTSYLWTTYKREWGNIGSHPLLHEVQIRTKLHGYESHAPDAAALELAGRVINYLDNSDCTEHEARLYEVARLAKQYKDGGL